MLEIKCGNPDEGPSSYTRFILPFGYQLKKLEIDTNNNPQPIYFADISDKTWRERYLTVETADVLFHRAKWFKLKDSGGNMKFDIPATDRARKFSVSMDPPRLVLFEWPKSIEDSKNNKTGKTDVLHTGFLIIELHLDTPSNNPTLDDMLRLNELFRYWQQPFPSHQDGEINGHSYKSFLSDCPCKWGSSEKLGGKGEPVELYFDRWASFLEIPVFEGNNYYELFPADWRQGARDKVAKGLHMNSPKKDWLVYADNRTFVWTCAIMGDGGSELRRVFRFLDEEGKPWKFGHWIRLLNVDLPGKDWIATHGSTEFERTWAEERTYKRWEEWGTFYGFSYHSGAMIGPPMNDTEETPRENKGSPLWKHFREMYFDQVLLLLYLRITLFRFSMELNKISGNARDTGAEEGEEVWQQDFQDLRWQFALFANLYQFPLLSNQQQGIEMYPIARKCLDVDELFEEIEKEIHSSHDYLAVKQAQKQADIMTRLTVVAAFGLAFALTMSFFGMNIIIDGLKDGTPSWYGVKEWGIFFVSLGIGFLILWFANKKIETISKWLGISKEDKR
jgi:hypothetical protein